MKNCTVYYPRNCLKTRTYSADFFDVQLFDDVKLKPKAHFVFHYHLSHMIDQFGPLVKALSFKAMNGYFKGLYSNNKTQKNLSQHLVKHHQFMMHLH